MSVGIRFVLREKKCGSILASTNATPHDSLSLSGIVAHIQDPLEVKVTADERYNPILTTEYHSLLPK